MSLDKLLGRFYRKVFVGLCASGPDTEAGVLTLTGSGREAAYERRTFPATEVEALAEFVQDVIDRTPCNYIAVLDDGACGAVATCSPSKAREMAPAVASAGTVCIDEEWMNFLDEERMHETLQRFEAFAPDALYTPFVLLHSFFGSTIAGAHALYLLLTPASLNVVVAKERHLRFAERFSLEGKTGRAMTEPVVRTLESYYGKPC